MSKDAKLSWQRGIQCGEELVYGNLRNQMGVWARAWGRSELALHMVIPPPRCDHWHWLMTSLRTRMAMERVGHDWTTERFVEKADSLAHVRMPTHNPRRQDCLTLSKTSTISQPLTKHGPICISFHLHIFSLSLFFASYLPILISLSVQPDFKK